MFMEQIPHPDLSPYRQVELQSEGHKLFCWLPIQGLKPGMVITLEGDETNTKWQVKQVYKAILPKDALRRDWRVGGL